MRNRGWYWPWLLTGLLLAGVGVNLGFFLVATGDSSFAVEKDYYRRALRWDEAMAQEKHNKELGWKVSIEVRPLSSGAGPARILALVEDSGGVPLRGALVEIDAFHNARAADVLHATLAESGAGSYGGNLTMRRSGLWEFKVRVVRGGELFTAKRLEEVVLPR